MRKREQHIIRPYEDVRLAKHHKQTTKDFRWARQMAALYQAVPIDEGCAENFYKFVTDVFNAGVISGKREERARRHIDQYGTARNITRQECEAIKTFLRLSWGNQIRVADIARHLLNEAQEVAV